MAEHFLGFSPVGRLKITSQPANTSTAFFSVSTIVCESTITADQISEEILSREIFLEAHETLFQLKLTLLVSPVQFHEFG